MLWGAGEVEYARKADGTSVAYRVVGDGPVDVVFGAGLACHLDLLRADPHCDGFVRRLARVGRLVLFDKPGTGLSDPLMAPPTLADRAEDFLAVMDAAGVRRGVVVGFSEASAPACSLAASHPDRVEALVLVSGVLRFVPTPDYVPDLHDYLADPVWRHLDHSYQHWGDGTFLLAVSPFVRRSAVYRRLAPAIERACAPPAMLRSIVDGLRGYDAVPLAAQVRVPTLVLNRAEEWTPRRVAEDLAERIAGARLRVLPGDEHLCVFDGEDVADEIAAFVAGAPAAVAPRRDRALMTLLFTDIVGSTSTAAELGDARWRARLEQHDADVRDVVGRLGGRVVKQLGDGALAAFDRPATAIEAALALHEAAAGLGLELRAGLHTGECELVDDDVAGIAVHLAARVAALAGAGETLATATVRDLVLGSDVRWTDRGEHALKGLPGSWQVVAVDRGRASPPPPVVEPAGVPEQALQLVWGRAPRASRATMRLVGRLRSRTTEPPVVPLQPR